MRARKAMATLFSLALVFSMVPASAIAEELQVAPDVEASAAEVSPVIEFRLNAVDDAEEEGWASLDGKDAAQKAADEAIPQTDAATRLEARVKGASENGLVKLSALQGDKWTEEAETVTGAFTDLKISLDDVMASEYDVWYRVYAGDKWLEWSSNGAAAADQNKDEVTDVQIYLLKKDAAADTDRAEETAEVAKKDEKTGKDETSDAKTDGKASAENQVTEDQDETVAIGAVEAEAASAAPSVNYRVHTQTYGWMDEVSNGAVAGTTGQSKRLEAIQISLPAGTDGGISYRVHAQTYGWMDEASNGAEAGTTGQAKRLEAIQIWLTGEVSKTYDVYYRCHIQSYGWLNWASNGATSGSSGLSRRAEAVQVMLVRKGEAGPANDSGRNETYIRIPTINYRGHAQTYGWLDWASNGDVAGTTGQSKRLESLVANISDTEESGEVQISYSSRVGQ